ncbi:hypothetical protein [Pedobacter immunditicola]|uniref:hypothetical protein n=1 Tax=Pedobacter immunditicola TaxID=3133440 RepID=UPI0030972338
MPLQVNYHDVLSPLLQNFLGDQRISLGVIYKGFGAIAGDVLQQHLKYINRNLDDACLSKFRLDNESFNFYF